MIAVTGLIWDDWNRKHIKKHNITLEEVEEVCHGKYKAGESYRKRFIIEGKTKKGRLITIILSPEDKYLKPYEKGIYYVISAFERKVKNV